MSELESVPMNIVLATEAAQALGQHISHCVGTAEQERIVFSQDT
jgi:hypothetical protein